MVAFSSYTSRDFPDPYFCDFVTKNNNNTALAACLDGDFESTKLASQMATEMLRDIDNQLVEGASSDDSNKKQPDEYTNVIPDYSTKALTRKLMKQLKQNWEEGKIDKKEAKATLRVPLLQLVEFSKSKAAQAVADQFAARKKAMEEQQEDSENQLAATTSQDEVELEYSDASKAHRTAEV